MVNKGLRSHWIRLSTIPFTAAGIVALSLPAAAIFPAGYRLDPTREDFQTCASELLASGVSEAETAIACSQALHPEELSECVVRIDEATIVEAPDALSRCRRVRRPTEMATCVIEIAEVRGEAIAPEALDYCRNTLLPLRFSNCVAGITTEIPLSNEVALATCIAAGTQPIIFAPGFIPGTPVDPAR